jgi:hypothetical protein
LPTFTASHPSLLPTDSSFVLWNEPFPYVIRSPAVPPDYYRNLAAAFPEPAVILGRRDGKMNNAAARLPFIKIHDNSSIAEIWRDFFDYHTSEMFWRDILFNFATDFYQRFPMAETLADKAFADWRIAPRGGDESADAWIDCQFVINTAVTKESSVKTVHVDKRNTMLSGLFYLRDDRDQIAGGDLSLYKWRRDPRFLKHRMILSDDVELVRTIKYDANLFVGFVNGAFAAHAVSPRGMTSIPRRYINLIVETKDNLFDLPPVSCWVQVWHWRNVRRTGYRSLGGDRN